MSARLWQIVFSALLAAALTACGGGGGGEAAPTTTHSDKTTTLAGMVVKGLVSNADVRVYRLEGGALAAAPIAVGEPNFS